MNGLRFSFTASLIPVLLLIIHMARHNFATLITLSKGVPLETVSQMMGHKCFRTTQIYAKLTRQKINEDMKKLSDRIGQKYKLPDNNDKSK